MTIPVNIAVLVLVAAGTWWLGGVDRTSGGESKRDHHLTRALRCLAVVFFAALFLLAIELNLGYFAIPLLMIAPISIALILRSSLAEIGAHGFLRGIDPMLHDHREFDPKKAQRHRDAIAYLIHHGRRDQAIRMCEELKQSGELDEATLKDTLEFLGVNQDRRKAVDPLAEAARLRTQRRFVDAESLLNSLLRKNPADHGAAIMLMRLYALDLRQPERAGRVLAEFEKQPHVSPDHVQYARRSIPGWAAGRPDGVLAVPDSPGAAPAPGIPGDSAAPGAGLSPNPPRPQAVPRFNPELVDKLLAHGSLGTAVEMLEKQIKAQPQEFALRLKLAEVYAVHCKDLPRAEKIVAQLEQAASLPPEYSTMLRAKLEAWRALDATKPR